MSVESFSPYPDPGGIETFGGLCTVADPGDVPLGMSPDCADVEFVTGSVRTRGGFASAASLGSTRKGNGIGRYVDGNGTQKAIVVADDGTLYSIDTTTFALTLLSSSVTPGATVRTAAEFETAWMAFSKNGAACHPPLQYAPGGLLRRVSQCGPGAYLGTVTEPTLSALTLTGVSRTTNVTTATTSGAHGLSLGQVVTIAGVTDITFNVNLVQVTSVPSGTTFTYANVGANATSTGGTATPNVLGSSQIGLHKVSVFFITDTGYWTKPAPAVSFQASGNSKYTVPNLPLGPSNVVARAVCITLANGARFYHLADRMLVNDNVTTTITFDVSDSTLASGLNVDYLFLIEVLGPCTNVRAYGERLVWTGERNHIQGFNNMGFEGGAVSGYVPLGWGDASNPFTGTFTAGSGVFNDPSYGAGLRLVGDGAKLSVGVFQSAVQDAWFQVPLLEPFVSYSVTARVRKVGTPTQGQFNIDLYSVAGGIDTNGLVLHAADVTATYAEYTGTFAVPLPSVPSDLQLRVFVDGTPTNGAGFDVDEIRIYPTNQPALDFRLRFSDVADGETFRSDAVANVAENEGRPILSTLELRDFLYAVKGGSIYATADDGVNQPASWTVEQVSPKIGILGVAAIGQGDNWYVLAGEDGAWLFDGGIFSPDKLLSYEITPTWQRINPAAQNQVWVEVDKTHRRVLFGVPLDSATEPSHTLVLDYSEGFGNGMANGGHGRKWTIWNFAAKSCSAVRGASDYLLFGNQAGNGALYTQATANLNDGGTTKINGYYHTAYCGVVGFGNVLFGYLAAAVQGAGTLLIKAYKPGLTFAKQLASRVLANPNTADPGMTVNISASRVSFRVETNGLTDWFQLSKFVPYSKQDPWSPNNSK